MKKHNFTKLLSTFLALILVLSLATPFSALANTSADNNNGSEAVETAVKTKAFKDKLSNESTMQQKAAIAEQLNLLGGDAKLHEQLQNVTGNQLVPVIIHLSEPSVGLETGKRKLAGKSLSATEAQAVKQKARSQQIRAKKEMMIKGIQFSEGFSYDTVLNGMSGTVKANDIEKLLTIDGITLVEPDTEVHAFEANKSKSLTAQKNLKKPAPSDNKLKDKAKDSIVDAKMDTSIGFLGIDALWAEGYEGQGIKVAVLDTGIDADHPDFQGIYKGGKNFVPHTGTDYARPRADNDASETSPKDRPANKPEFNANGSSFYTSHGTHVAGTIAAIGNNEYGIKGIAPKVDLYAYRVLGAYGSGSTSGIIKAIDTAVIEGMHVINLSLGGGANSETDGASFAINNAMLAGTISVIATGNSGPNRGTMGTPATSRLGIAVANTTNPELSAVKAEVTNGGFNLTNNVKFFYTPYGIDLKAELAGELDIIAIPGVGKESDYNQLDVTGKVVHVSRGEIAFTEKIQIATEKGAKAIIIYNSKDHADGNDNPMSNVGGGSVFDVQIPSFNMSYNDGKAIKDGLANEVGKIVFDAANLIYTTGDEVNDSSSRGPSTPNFDIKPDVAAPGTNIMSTIPMYKADFPEATYEHAYTRKTGTSMATPHIAGIAALVKQANPSWNAFDVKVALSNTAKVLDTGKYDVFAQGAGRIQAYQAAHPEILAYAIDTANNDGATVENKKGTVTFGPQSLKDNVSVTKQIVVQNKNGNGGAYNATVEVTKGFADASVTIDKPTFTLSGEETLNVTLTASQNTNAKPGDEILGYIHITGGSTTASLPFAADFGGAAAAEVKDMTISETDLSFNGDGVKDEAMLRFTITGDVGTNFIEIWNIMDPEGGAYGDGYIGYLHASSALGAGSYQLPIKGQYSPWDGTGATTIPDGLYTIDFTAETVSGNPPVIGDYVGPLVVKSEAGTVTGAIEGTTATGAIDDAYIGYQQELVDYGMGYNINTKLKAKYEVIEGEAVIATDTITLEQDGTFTFDLPELDKKNNSVKVKYEDAAGNKAEAIIYNAGDQVDNEVTYKVNHETLALKVGNSEQLTVTETTTKPDGTTEEKDVTAEATFTSSNEAIATATNGNVTAIAAGTADITVTYKDFTATVAVEVTEEPVTGEETVTYSVNKTNLILGEGQQEQLYVTETTVKADGTVIEKDVTGHLRYNVVNNTYATVQKGLVTAKLAGKTQVRIQIEGEPSIYVYLEVTKAPQNSITYTVSQTHLNVGVGQSEQVYVTETTVTPEGDVSTRDVTGFGQYKVIDNTVATVKKGLVTGLKDGKTQLRINVYNSSNQTADNLKETIYVYLNVEKLPQNIVTYDLNTTDMTMEVGEQKQLKVTETTVTPAGTTTERDATVDTKFSVVNNTLATVQRGLVTAHAPGKTQVRVVMPNGDVTLVYLEVTGTPEEPEQPVEPEQPDTITFAVNKNDIALNVGESDQLTVTQTTTKADGTSTEQDVTATSTFTSNDEAVATVTNGTITAVGPGQTAITVTNGDFTATISVDVVAIEEPEVEEPQRNVYTLAEDNVGSKSENIYIDLSSFDGEANIEISAAVLGKMVDAKNEITIQKDGAVFMLHKNILKDIHTDITISVAKNDASTIAGAVSDMYTITFWNGIGEAKQQLTALNKKIEIKMSVYSNNKVKIMNVLTNEVVSKNANPKNGTVEFKSDNAGSFVAIEI
ncbi:S8 family serine peptidase [Sporosarcina sp. Sa2YVA2]|uniref:S8 family serine peptidase n=1 Tax=Sporosarcina quadrami TaxID=2762234 RepID=A0ABR8U9B3_9BACL|nr:S8 family serine peptidase [Sporosarcina quadrami]MBD7984606.1 S8 family serine peptidase [Sporosarcina quadrami]